jgi:predicted metal-dependent hydrolase
LGRRCPSWPDSLEGQPQEVDLLSVTAPISYGFVELVLDDGPLHFELRRSSRRSIGISVHPGGAVVVTAPKRASMGKIYETLQEHGSWVRQQVSSFRNVPSPPPPPKWIDGEPYPFLGKAYPLRLIQAEEKGVWRTDHEILVHLPHPSRKKMVRDLVKGWEQEEARAVFQHRMNLLIRDTPALDVRVTPVLKLRRMKARWGSCSPDGTILMNTHAIKVPLRLVEYILVHELCHLKVPNHSAEFWAYLDRCMPDWKRRKDALDRQIV